MEKGLQDLCIDVTQQSNEIAERAKKMIDFIQTYADMKTVDSAQSLCAFVFAQSNLLHIQDAINDIKAKFDDISGELKI